VNSGPADSRRLHVLLTEDNAVNQMLVKGILQRHGHQVVVAKTGNEALAALETQPFDAVLMDVQMPELNGFDATTTIRMYEAAGRVFTRNASNRLPIIAMTAQAADDDREQCARAGMDAYLAKPIEPNRLLNTLDAAVSGTSPVKHGPDMVSRLDRSALDALVGGKPERLRKLVETFQAESVQLLTQIREAVTAADAPRLRRAAHSLKGAVAIFGAPTATGAAQRLESIGESGQLADAPGAVQALERELASLRPALAGLVGEG
jgi:CheY-like chemotaxis protein